MRQYVRTEDMPRIGQVGKVTIHMNYRERHQPHVHARYERRFTRFEIETGEVMDNRTNLTVRQERNVRDWILDRVDDLLDRWHGDRADQEERERSSKRRRKR